MGAGPGILVAGARGGGGHEYIPVDGGEPIAWGSGRGYEGMGAQIQCIYTSRQHAAGTAGRLQVRHDMAGSADI